jgi:hypothetical protein
MNDPMDLANTEVDDEGGPGLKWEVPEIAAVAVLVAFAIVVAGGLVAGVIVASTSEDGAFSPAGLATGDALIDGTTWAGPLLAFALLAVAGVSWWQINRWNELSREDRPNRDDYEVQSHLERGRRIGLAAQLALALTVAGSAAALIGTVLFSFGGGAQSWVRYVVSGANLIAVAVVAAGGWKIGRSTRRGLARASTRSGMLDEAGSFDSR